MNLQQRHMEILNYMFKHEDWLTGKELSSLFNVSIRTIRNDISYINKEFKKDILISSKYYGYKIDKNLYNIEKTTLFQPLTSEERLAHILIELLLKPGVPLHYFDLAEQYYISEFTLAHDLQVIKNILVSHSYANVFIEKKNEYITCIGSFIDCAKILHSFIKEKGYYKNFLNFDKCFLYVDLIKIKESIDIQANPLNYTRYLTYEDVLIYSCIFIEQSHFIQDNADIIYELNANEILDIYPHINSLLNELSLNQSNFIKTNFYKTIHPLVEIEKKEILIKKNTDKNDPMYPVLLDILMDVKHKYNLDICSNENLIIDFLVHIKISLLRIQNGISTNNPLIEYIRLNYTFLFDVAYYISRNLSEILNLEFSKQEISFFVVYLINPLKTIKDQLLQQYSVQILLYAIEGPSISKNIKTLLLAELDHSKVKIHWINSTDELLDNSYKYYDILLTTASYVQTNYETIHINPFLSSMDIKNIETSVTRVYTKKQKEHFSQLFNYFFDEKFTQFKSSIKDEYISLKYMCNQFAENKITPPDYFDQVIDRERLISTAFDSGISLPHATENSAYKSKIYFMNYENSLDWDGRKIKNTFLFAIAKEDISLLNLIYKIIIDICTSDYYSNLLSKTTSYEELKDLMHDVYLNIR